MDLFKLVGSIFIDNDKANDSLQKTDDKAKKVGTSFKDIAGKAAKVGTAIVGASTAAVSGIIAMADSTAQAADEIDKGSIRMGISTDSYQELAYAAGQCGVEMGMMEKAAKQLEGTGLNMDDAIKEVMSLETAEERSAKAAELFGDKIAYELSPLIEQSGEDFEALTQRAHDLGIVMSEEDVKAGVELGDTMSDVKQSFAAVGKQLGSAVMPLVQKFAEKILQWMPTIMAMFEQIAPLIAMVFDKLMPPLLDLAEQIFPIVMDFLQQLLPPVIEIVSAILPLFVTLLQAFMPILKPVLDLLLAILPAVVDIINFAVKPLVELLGGGLKIAMEWIGKGISLVADMFTQAWDAIRNAWSNAGTFFSNLFEGIKNVLKNALNGIIWFVNKMIDGINILLAPLRTVIMAVGNLFGANWTMGDVKIPQIPALAEGGVTARPGWAVTGEEGPELQYLNRGATVVPLDRAPGFNNSSDLERKVDILIDLFRQLLSNNASMGVYIDGNALVGKIAPGMDRALGRLAAQNGRNV